MTKELKINFYTISPILKKEIKFLPFHKISQMKCKQYFHLVLMLSLVRLTI